MSHQLGGTTAEDDHVGRQRAGPESAPPWLFRLIEGEAPRSLPGRTCLRGLDEVTLGRSDAHRATLEGRTLALGLPDRFLSSKHASLSRTERGWCLTDLGSKNGTLVGGAVIEKRLLADGDLFEVGHTLFLFRESLPAPPEFGVQLEASSVHVAPGMLTLDPVFAAVLAQLDAVAPSKLSVLITGESGTGKELATNALHARSGRKGALVAVNCAAIAPTLLEAQLFGHKKGAFSGADDDAPGLVRASDRGTLFLDEVGELSLTAQAALLRVLAQGVVLPVGGTQTVAVDLRVVCATNRDLRAMVEAGTFRADLLARLQGFTLELPPLRERQADLGLLVATLLQRHAPPDAEVRFEPQAMRALARWKWPLNVRELDQALASALLLSQGKVIELAHLPPEVRGEGRRAVVASELPDDEQAFRARLVALLVENDGNVSAVARLLGKARNQVVRWVQRYGIDPAQPK
jgi:transcriptional regulator with AAA-type ATPase domain